MRSDTVVFPASMCAMMPMLRIRSMGKGGAMAEGRCYGTSREGGRTEEEVGSRGGGRRRAGRGGGARGPRESDGPGFPGPWSTTFEGGGRLAPTLPGVVGEGLVGLGHLVHVLAGEVRAALAAGREDELLGEPLAHGLAALLPRGLEDPAD